MGSDAKTPLTEDEEVVQISEEIQCGIWGFRGPWLQRFANKKAYVALYGLLGCIYSASYAYFHGTITTMEKRFKIPSRTTGIITVGNDISQLMISMVLSYYAGKGHRPRWIAAGIYTVVLFCLMNALPHFLYGAGEDALYLTAEYSDEEDNTTHHGSYDRHNRATLCQEGEGLGLKCDESEGNLFPQIILFCAQFVSGIGGPLYYTLGVSYMDDNIKKSKTPALVSFSYFIRMLGPAIGYALASLCLQFYISPSLTPKIDYKDPRWLGAWWIGWLALAAVMFVIASMIGLFPKTLPRAAQRKLKAVESNPKFVYEPDMPASLKDMVVTFKRLLRNKTLMCNNFAAVFYFMGYMPYWLFMPKYIETLYKQSASGASLITGTVGLIFSALGILISGLVITKWKPQARPLAMWNVVVGAISVLGIISYAFLGCQEVQNSALIGDSEHEMMQSCNINCNCEFVKYTPICLNGATYISPCHAGCKQQVHLANQTLLLQECSCGGNKTEDPFSQTATTGACTIDCSTKFYMFLAVVCLLKFTGATGRASNFLVSVRCVEEKDKPVAMGFGLMVMSMFAFIPSPIIFGYIIDTTCIVWGKTCTGTGNCWLYDGEQLRYLWNFSAAVFVTIGTFLDLGVWYYVKDLAIFDEEVEMDELKNSQTVDKINNILFDNTLNSHSLSTVANSHTVENTISNQIVDSPTNNFAM